jgi:hypothetical protein
MNRKRQQPSSQRKMTRKDALSVLYDLREAYIGRLSYEQYQKQRDTFLDQVLDALILLTDAVYGPPNLSQCLYPCGVCRRRRAEEVVYVQVQSGWPVKWYCRVCYDRLRAEGSYARSRKNRHPLLNAQLMCLNRLNCKQRKDQENDEHWIACRDC